MKSVFLLFSFIIFISLGCQENISVNPEDNSNLQHNTASWKADAQDQNIDLIKLPINTSNSLQKVVTQMVYAGQTNIINYDFEYVAVTGQRVKVDAKLRIPPEALSEDIEIILSVDEEYLVTEISFTFGPAGQTFLKPLLLDIKANGLELSDLDQNDKLKFVYYNETTGTWDEMVVKFIKVDTEDGELFCLQGNIPHFSRYGFTR